MEEFLINTIEEISFERVNPTDSLWEEKVLDSITVVELAVEIENEFNVKIGFDEIIVEHFETVELLKAFIEKKLK